MARGLVQLATVPSHSVRFSISTCSRDKRARWLAPRRAHPDSPAHRLATAHHPSGTPFSAATVSAADPGELLDLDPGGQVHRRVDGLVEERRQRAPAQIDLVLDGLVPAGPHPIALRRRGHRREPRVPEAGTSTTRSWTWRKRTRTRTWAASPSTRTSVRAADPAGPAAVPVSGPWAPAVDVGGGGTGRRTATDCGSWPPRRDRGRARTPRRERRRPAAGRGKGVVDVTAGFTARFKSSSTAWSHVGSASRALNLGQGVGPLGGQPDPASPGSTGPWRRARRPPAGGSGPRGATARARPRGPTARREHRAAEQQDERDVAVAEPGQVGRGRHLRVVGAREGQVDLRSPRRSGRRSSPPASTGTAAATAPHCDGGPNGSTRRSCSPGPYGRRWGSMRTCARRATAPTAAPRCSVTRSRKVMVGVKANRSTAPSTIAKPTQPPGTTGTRGAWNGHVSRRHVARARTSSKKAVSCPRASSPPSKPVQSRRRWPTNR